MTNCPTARRSGLHPSSSIAILAAMLAATFTAGCSMNWDSSGIHDVLFGGKKPADIGVAAPDSGTNADAAMGGTQAAPPAESTIDEAQSMLRRIAVLPVAYVDAAGEGQPCDLCPADLKMKPTSRLPARLITGFLYEKIARHPRLLFPTPETVDKFMAASPTHSLRQLAASLAAAGKADYAVVGALQDLRQRVGPDDDPTTPAGVTLYAALIEAKTGKILWSDTFDKEESGRGIFYGAYDKLMNDKPVRWSTAEGFSEQAADKLMDELVGEVP